MGLVRGEKMEFITLEEARRRLGEDVVICIESESILDAKLKAGKEQDLWVFNPEIGRLNRGDGRFFDVRYFDRGGWGQPGIYEEPNLDQEENRVIGHVIIDMDIRGRVQTREAKGLNGPMLELKPSSLSKGELADKDQEPIGYFESNPQRIGGGLVAVYLNRVDKAEGEGWMLPADVARNSTDGRSFSALAKAGLLS